MVKRIECVSFVEIQDSNGSVPKTPDAPAKYMGFSEEDVGDIPVEKWDVDSGGELVSMRLVYFLFFPLVCRGWPRKVESIKRLKIEQKKRHAGPL